MTDIRATLDERGKVHGNFSEDARVGQSIKDAMHNSINWQVLPPYMREALEHIATKAARILTGNPHHKDHWDDIAGYATLAGDRAGKGEK